MTEIFLTERLETTLSDIKHVFNLGLLDRLDEVEIKLNRVATKAEKSCLAIAKRDLVIHEDSWLRIHYPELDAL